MQNFRPFPLCFLREMPGNPKFDPLHWVKVTLKGGKSTDHDHNLISSEGAQDTSTCKISDHSLHACSGQCQETSPDGRTDRRICRKTAMVGRMDHRTHVQMKRGFSGFGRTDGRTDGQPENIMPPAPKGGGITNNNTSCCPADGLCC